MQLSAYFLKTNLPEVDIIEALTAVKDGAVERCISSTYDLDGAVERCISSTYDLDGAVERCISSTYDLLE